MTRRSARSSPRPAMVMSVLPVTGLLRSASRPVTAHGGRAFQVPRVGWGAGVGCTRYCSAGREVDQQVDASEAVCQEESNEMRRKVAGGVKANPSSSARHPAWRRTPQRRVVEDARDRETLLLEIGDEWGQLVGQVDRPGAPGAVGIAPPAWPVVDQGQSFVTDAGTRRHRGATAGEGVGHFRGPSWPLTASEAYAGGDGGRCPREEVLGCFHCTPVRVLHGPP